MNSENHAGAVPPAQEPSNKSHQPGGEDVKPKTHRHKWWPPHRPHLSRKQWVVVAVIVVLAIAGGGAGAYFAWFKHPAPKPTPVVKKKAAPKPTPVQPVSTLTGMPISDATLNDKPVTAVMIENSPDARPQSALDQAGVVFEAIAEGGITRFLALFQDTSPSYVGPIRSVRPYYLQWLMGFDAAVAHVGGSAEALQDIRVWGVKDLDQFANGRYYHRITSRYAPHNVYTSMAELNALEAAKGYGKANYVGFARKAATPSKAPNASSVDFAISGYTYNVHYDYIAASNNYRRSEGGAAHNSVDATGAQAAITPKVVIGMVLPQGIAADDLHTSYNTLGTGPAYIFQDGTVIQSTWHKASNTEQISFTSDIDGSIVRLNPGQTWITALGKTSYITYK